MKKILSLLLVALMVLSLVACGTTPSATSPSGAGSSSPVPAANIKIGAIEIGDQNEGYTAAHINGLNEACQELGIPSSNVIYKYNIPEDQTCYDAAVDLAEQGCNLIFANSFGHESYMEQAAQAYPDIVFAHASGTMARSAGLPNFCNYFDDIFEARYVSGIVGGMKLKELMDAGTVTNPYVGYVGAYPYAEVVSGFTAFFLGVQSIVPSAHMDVQYTNSWFNITAEAEAANALMARGAVIIGQHADSTGAPSAVQAALNSGKTAYSVGYNVDMLSVAPTAALTSAQNNWAVEYKAIIQDVMQGNAIKTDYSAGYADDGVQISELGSSCADGTQEAVDAAIAAIKDGSLHVFDLSTFTCPTPDSNDGSAGYTVDDSGHVTLAYATDTNGDFVNDADNAAFDSYYHESYFQSAPSFSLLINDIDILN